MSDPPRNPKSPIFPAIPEPTPDVQSLLVTVQRLKEAVELLTGQRGTTDMLAQYSLQGVLRELKGEGSRVYELNEVAAGLARRVEGVEAVSGDVSASGQVVISAEANPAGYKAYFGVYLRATADSSPGTERRAGLHLGLTNSDGGVLALDVDKFIIRDPGSGTASSQVFTYASGNFTLAGNVYLNGNLVVSGTITTGGIGYNQVGLFTQTSGGSTDRNSDDSNWSTIGSRTITGVAGGYAFILASVDIYATNDPAMAGKTVYIRIYKGGSELKTAPFILSSNPGNVGQCTVAVFDADASLNYTYTVACNTQGTPSGYVVRFLVREFTVMVHKR